MKTRRKMNSNILNTRVSELTVEQLLSIIDRHFEERAESRKIRGIDGLAEYLHCSVRTASRLKASGQIDKAIIQAGRTVVFDEMQLRKLLQAR